MNKEREYILVSEDRETDIKRVWRGERKRRKRGSEGERRIEE
jgi:hypothetical protein